MYKGIILAGGKGTRFQPLTNAISKQLLPVYREPMIHYPIRTLKDMGIKEILIIVDPSQLSLFEAALKDVDQFGISVSFKIQDKPRGIAEALIIAEEWLGGCNAALILGDNIFITPNLPDLGDKKFLKQPNAIFTYSVVDPSRYGVVYQVDGAIEKLVEKPTSFVSNDAVVGLYLLDNEACKYAKNLKPSKRNELEIVDLIKVMDVEHSQFSIFNIGGFWFDAGTHDDLLDCANFIRAVEHRTGKCSGLHN
jgi:glucose-1-phosphate thymidylyltransferase